MSESVILLLGLLAVSCPLSALLGGLVVAVLFRAFADRNKANGHQNHQRIRTICLPRIPKGEVYHTVKRWAEDGWNYQVLESKTVEQCDIILSKYL
jgi:hypothetical protein